MTTLIEKIKPASLENYELENLISKTKQKRAVCLRMIFSKNATANCRIDVKKDQLVVLPNKCV